jgi:L-seryl-tRNA(Ser) seleniumtransferase
MKINTNLELRKLPSIEKLLANRDLVTKIDCFSRPVVLLAAQQAISDIREEIKEGQLCPDKSEIIVRISDYLVAEWPNFLEPVINGTGIILHTNLGRAPLSDKVISAISKLGANYTALELDLQSGKRGGRTVELDKLLKILTGADAALVVNNNAAAVYLVLKALAEGREAIVSRGEQVQIGGGFRIPEVMAASGALMREVGTTNQSYIEDFERAITPQTSLLMKIHPSNFVVAGFAHEVSSAELKALAVKHSLPFYYDLGSGALLNTEQYTDGHEPTIQEALADADLVSFSGDKLLGGLQSGIILGKTNLIDRLKKHPFMRAVRIDKLTALALEVTLLQFLKKDEAKTIPVWCMISTPVDELRLRARSITRKLKSSDLKIETIAGKSMVGGGSLPVETIPSCLLSIRTNYSANELSRRLRLLSPAVLGRIQEDRFIIDLRTVFPSWDDKLVEIIRKATL